MADRALREPLDPRSEAAVRQDAAWRACVERFRAAPATPFAEQWAAYRETFAGRAAEDGPPRAWTPTEAHLSETNVARFALERGDATYRALHAWSASDRAGFWGAVVERLGIVFERAPDRVLAPYDPTSPEAVASVEWLPGARLDITASCFAADPEAPAIVTPARDRRRGASLETIAYGELERRVRRFAAGLRALGFSSGDRVALYLPMTPECVVAYLGILRAGCVAVSVADSFSPRELRTRLEIAGACGVVTVDGYRRGDKVIEIYRKVVEAAAPRAIVVEQAALGVALREGDVPFARVDAEPDELVSAAAPADAPIHVLFSSGTTGDPKAIPWTQATPIKCAMDAHFHHDVRVGDVVAWPTNIGWMMGPWLIFAALLNRATIALDPESPQGEGFTTFVRDAGVTMLGVVPALVRAWRASGAVGFGAWGAVRSFGSTGEASNPEDYLWLMSRTGYRAPVVEYLGGTEIGGGHITGTVVEPAAPSTFTTPALGIDVVVLDEAGAPVAPGASGELFLVPPAIGLSKTLLNRDHHATYYAGAPRGPNGEVLRRHGDRIRVLHHGGFVAEGRADDTMNLGGIKVGSLEIERTLVGHPDVAECAAVGVAPEGGGPERLVVWVRPATPEAPPEASALARALGRRLAESLNPLFKVDEVRFVDALPRTASGKLIRRRG